MNSKQFGRIKLAVAVIVTAVVLLACDREAPIGPPAIHFGEDMCDVCHMIVSDERYAAGVVTTDEYGRRTNLAFDDIGCVFEFETQNPDQPIKAVFVRDLRTQQWLDAESAHFVHSRELHTPMAFGLAALADEDAAAEVHETYGGDRIDLAEARDRFRRGVLHVERIETAHAGPDGKPDGSPAAGEGGAGHEGIIVELVDGTKLRLAIEPPGTVRPGKHPIVIVVERQVEAGEWRPTGEYEFRIEPTMPSMGHGSPGNEHPEHESDGRYVGQVNFTMSGQWIVELMVLEGGETVGETTLDYKVAR